MASAKDVYESHIYRANMYAAGIWRGVGVDVVPEDDIYPGSLTATRTGPGSLTATASGPRSLTASASGARSLTASRKNS